MVALIIVPPTYQSIHRERGTRDKNKFVIGAEVTHLVLSFKTKQPTLKQRSPLVEHASITLKETKKTEVVANP